MTHARRLARWLALFAVLALGLAACTATPEADDEPTETETATPTETTTVSGTPTDTETPTDGETTAGEGPFAALKLAATTINDNATNLATGVAQAAEIEGVDTQGAVIVNLVSQELQEHVYLTGVFVEQTLLGREDAAAAAEAALDANSVDLADVVGSVSSPEDREAFLALWRQHIGFFVDYTTAAAAGDETGKEAALQDLAQYQQDAGAFFEDLTGGTITQDQVAESLQAHVDTTTAAIDAFVADAPDAFDLLKVAADQVADMNGPALGAAIADAQDVTGADSEGAELLRTLNTNLQEHVYLSGIAIEQALAQSGKFEAAAETLDANTVEIADTVASVPGVTDDQRTAFLELWRQHIGFFGDYAAGVAEGDEAAKEAALEDLAGYEQDAGAFFEDITGGVITSDQVVMGLERHVETLTQAIDLLGEALVGTGSGGATGAPTGSPTAPTAGATTGATTGATPTPTSS